MAISDWADLFSGYVTVTPLVYADDPRGALYGKAWSAAPVGAVQALSRKLDSTERHERGKDDTTLRVQLLVDLRAGEAPLDEKMRLLHPDHPDQNDGLDVVSVVPYETEGLAIVEAEVTI